MREAEPLGEGWQFHCEEYKTLRAEIERHDRHRFLIEIYTISAYAILWAWGFNISIEYCNILLMTAILLVCLIVVIFGRMKSVSHVIRSKEIGEYLSQLENRFGFEGLGWEKFLSDKRKEQNHRKVQTKKKFLDGSISTSTNTMWGALLAFHLLSSVTFLLMMYLSLLPCTSLG